MSQGSAGAVDAKSREGQGAANGQSGAAGPPARSAPPANAPPAAGAPPAGSAPASAPPAAAAPAAPAAPSPAEQKTALEVEKLRREISLSERFVRYLPAIVAATALISTTFFLFRKMDADQQTGLRTDVERLTSFTSDDRQTVARTLYLMSEIDARVRENPGEERRITNAMIGMVRTELTFDNPRHVDLDANLIGQRPDYAAALRGDPSLHDSIFPTKYAQALTRLHNKSREYVESVQYDASIDLFRAPDTVDDNAALLLDKLVRGYRGHMTLFATGDPRRDRAVYVFRQTTQNAVLTQQLFGSQP